MFLRTQEVCAAEMAENVTLKNQVVVSSCHTRDKRSLAWRLLLGAAKLGGNV